MMVRRLKRELTSLITETLGYNVLPGGPVFGRRIEKQKRLGYNRHRDWRRFLSRTGDHVLFDVGANLGQTTLTFTDLFPRAKVYSFEPDPAVFQAFRASTADNPRVVATNAALGAGCGQADLFVNRLHVTNSLLDNGPKAGRYVESSWLEHQDVIPVDLVTIDSFCQERKVTRIDLLKIDAQGYELQVLKGARKLIDTGRIPLVYLEVSFVAIYKDQPLFLEIFEYLSSLRYKLVGLYGACSNQNYLVSSDALFVLDGHA